MKKLLKHADSVSVTFSGKKGFVKSYLGSDTANGSSVFLNTI